MAFHRHRAKLCLILILTLSFKITNAQLCRGTKVCLLDSINYTTPPEWHLMFEDDFNSDTLDLSKWQLTSIQGDSDGKGAYYTLDNVIVSPEKFYGNGTSATGICRIVCKKERVTRPPVSWNPSIPPATYDYTSSNINTIHKFGWGKYEIRCKIPKGKGFIPAFWMYSEENGEGHEIDVFEFLNEDNILHEYDKKKLSSMPQMHYHDADNSVPGNRIDHNCGVTYTPHPSIDYSQDYHTYSVIWNRFGVYWYVDGELRNLASQWYTLDGAPIDEYNIKPIQIVLRNDWYPKFDGMIIVDFGIETGKSKPDDDSPFPSYLDIDYIKYYSY